MLFPVAGPHKYTNDWHMPRSGGRLHQGTDIFADVGTPLVAVEPGDVRYGTDPLGGNIVTLTTNERIRYYYAHLDRFEGTNRAVVAGDVIGYVGKTGNAATTPPHLHFEVHPNGGEAVNPYPLLQVAETVPAPAPAPIERVAWAPTLGRALALIAMGFGAGVFGVAVWKEVAAKRAAMRGAR